MPTKGVRAKAEWKAHREALWKHRMRKAHDGITDAQYAAAKAFAVPLAYGRSAFACSHRQPPSQDVRWRQAHPFMGGGTTAAAAARRCSFVGAMSMAKRCAQPESAWWRHGRHALRRRRKPPKRCFVEPCYYGHGQPDWHTPSNACGRFRCPQHRSRLALGALRRLANCASVGANQASHRIEANQRNRA